MALEPNPKLAAVISGLADLFTPVFDSWRAAHPSESPTTARECLSQDVLQLGRTIAQRDNRGQRVETKLIAEALALLQAEKSSMPYEYVLENLDRQIASTPATSSLTLRTAQIVNAWASGKPDRTAKAKAIQEQLLKLVQYFVLYDGNISSQEMTLFDEIGKQFAA